MANLNEFLFIIGILGLLGATLFKLYNVMSNNKTYDFRISIISFIVGIILFSFSFVSSLLSIDNLVMSQFLRVASFLVGIFTGLFLIELILSFSASKNSERIEAHNSLGERR